MPRTARLSFENGFYHVFNRGLNKEKIFLTEPDYEFFLNKLVTLKEKYDHSVYACCLLPNHFHISIKTRKDSISKIIASLSTSYSMYFNRTHKHYGPVFQNRFKSIVIGSWEYFLELSRYIYLNPVSAGLIADPLLYRYSSLKEALGEVPLRLLDHDIVRLVGTSKKEKDNYKKFVYSGIKKDFSTIEKLFESEEAIFATRAIATHLNKKQAKRI